jgi:NitT/TauT family transport system permease protein
MALRRPFPTRGVLRRPPIRPVDLLVGAGILALLWAVLRLGRSMDVAFLPERASQQVSTDPANLPYYAARSLLQMFLALALSVASHQRAPVVGKSGRRS